MEKLEFIASIPPIPSAITLDGMGDGGRVKLDIPRKYNQALIALQAMAGKSIKITAVVEDVKTKSNVSEVEED